MRRLAIGLLALVPNLALAHAGNGSGFEAGLTHPVLGLDHLLAMVLVGVLAGQIGGKAMWQIPATFVALMTAGGVVGMLTLELPFVELGIMLSVVLLGIVVAVGQRVPRMLGLVIVAFFAVFHGHAHGTEMPNLAQPLMYALGFIVGSASLHIIGLMLVQLAHKVGNGALLCRFAGAVCVGMGLQMLIG
ncbi:HupE/UreJ family protein [uncultured Ferrimonas sp.]|uniref:HupE/UreJ family protein n=1 Tax=uncultured Ferrimonas sp. TaxID=432640 RepID=UPI00262A906B|nr:HupE/UreJ family protein [uncultured Ferrimonas sp.]